MVPTVRDMAAERDVRLRSLDGTERARTVGTPERTATAGLAVPVHGAGVTREEGDGGRFGAPWHRIRARPVRTALARPRTGSWSGCCGPARPPVRAWYRPPLSGGVRPVVPRPPYGRREENGG
ncbi:hypothetical protein GCM10010371_68270 [Streptomyces subrutilus]|uniref:Uncharacterized protein n=1 Tax=Streptomyces subrutilus TaxID=36818 RepID=A0A918VGB7_9ACTN|nr:hypothetical protein GCM10010371_68270 [Streptomyces subrutilus]